MRRFLLTIAIAAAAAFTVVASSPWEEVQRQRRTQNVERAINENDDFDVEIKDGWIFVTTAKPIQIKVFTILGQQISSETIPAGTFRMRLNSKGIYLLKVGTATRRIVI